MRRSAALALVFAALFVATASSTASNHSHSARSVVTATRRSS